MAFAATTAAPDSLASLGAIYDADYYLRGPETGKSLYQNYRWLPELTIPMVETIVAYLGAAPDDTFLDFGCARGYVVRALRAIGYTAHGIDASAWAIENADPVARPYVDQASLVSAPYDWILAKDVLEHLAEPTLHHTIVNLCGMARKGVFVVVPLSDVDGEPYVVPEYEADITHVQRRTLTSWLHLFTRYGRPLYATARYRVPGIKDNYAHYPYGNGFLTIGSQRLSAEREIAPPNRLAEGI